MKEISQLCIEADSELSAIAHGRNPGSRKELISISAKFREYYEKFVPVVLSQDDLDDIHESLEFLIADVDFDECPKLQRMKDLSDSIFEMRKVKFGNTFKVNG